MIRLIRENFNYFLILIAGLGIFSRGFLTFLWGGYSNFIVLALFLMPLVGVLIQKKFFIPKLSKLIFIIIIYLVYVIIMSFFAFSLIRAIVGLSILLYYYFLFFIINLLIKKEYKIYEHTVIVLHTLFIYLTLFAVWEIVTDLPLSTLEQYPTPVGMRSIFASFRISSSIGSTLPFGVVYAYLAIYIFSKYIYKPKLYNLILVVVSSYMIFGTFNRSSLGMMILGYVFVLYKYIKVNKIKIDTYKIFYMLIFLITAIVFYSFLPEVATNRIFAIFNWDTDLSNLKRFAHWKEVLNSLNSLKDIVFGVTVGASGNVLNYFGLKPGFGEWIVTESYYLKILGELGAIGLILFCSIIFLGIKYSHNFKMNSNSNLDEKIVKSFLFAAFTAHSVEMIFLQSLESTSVAFMFFLALGLINIIRELDRKLVYGN